MNCVTPGLIQTDITGGKLTDDVRREILNGVPLNRLDKAATADLAKYTDPAHLKAQPDRFCQMGMAEQR